MCELGAYRDRVFAMIRRYAPYVGVLLAVAAVGWAVLPAAGQQETKSLGKMRVQRMDGTTFVGEVEDTGDSYRIDTGKKIIVTIKKNEVKSITPVEDTGTSGAKPNEKSTGKPTPPSGSNGKASSSRREVTDEEIDELLAGINVEGSDVAAMKEDLVGELPLDEEGIQEMCRLGGVPRDDNHVLLKPHFVFLFTSKRSDAMELASRLEAIWNWRVKYMGMMDVPVKRPEHKLEIYYFGTHKEFEAYQVNTGGTPSMGLLGFYSPKDNRSAFFEMSTWPPLAHYLELAKDTRIPFKERQFARNIITQYVEFQNMEVVQHEAGHHIDFNIGLFPPDVSVDRETFDNLPRWFVEGTTMMFEFPPTKAGASLGTVNHGRLEEFDKIYGRKVKERRLSPQQLKSFVLDNMIFMRGGGATYSLGWSLVNYLYNKKREGLKKFYKIIASREPGTIVSTTMREKEFEDCFGRVDEKWVEDWYKYLDGLQLKKSVLPPELFP